MHKMKIKLLSLLLITSIVGAPSVAYAAETESQPVSASAESRVGTPDYIEVGVYEENKPFTWRSTPEPVPLDMDCNAITLHASCEDGQNDTLTANIINKEDGSPTFLVFQADGSYTTVARSFSEGLYTVYFTSDRNPDSVKTYACAIFTKANTSILSLSEVKKRARNSIEARERNVIRSEIR